MTNTVWRRILCVALSFIFAAVAVKGQELDMDQVRADEYFRWGVIAYHNGYYSNALLSFENALSFKAGNTQTHFWLGKTLYKSGLEEQALHEWRFVVQNDAGTQLLNSWIDFVSFRRTLDPELRQEYRYVLSSTIDAHAEANYPLRRPTSIRTRPDGTYYVVAFGTNEVLIVNINNSVVDILSGGIEGYDRPFDVLEVEGRWLFVTEYGRNQIAKCNLRGQKLSAFGKQGTAPGELLGPQYLAGDGRGYLYVTDFGNRRVSKYNFDGEFILSFGEKKGSFPGFSAPTGIAIQDDKVFVADRWQKNIAVFDTSGNYIATIADGNLNGPEAMKFSGPGRLVIADTSRILDYDVENDTGRVRGDLGSNVRRIVSADFDVNGGLLAVDFDFSRIFVLSKMTDLYTGYFVQIERIDAARFPALVADISVTSRAGKPIVGLEKENFIVSEFRRPIEDFEFYPVTLKHSPMGLVVVVEKSLTAQKNHEAVRRALGDVYDYFNESARLTMISAGSAPIVETAYGDKRLTFLEALNRGKFTDAWQFDASVRSAANQLLQSRGERAIVLVSQGGIGAHPYQRYSLMQLAQFLKNNAVRFNALFLQAENASPDIDYLCSATGGNSAYYYRPQGLESFLQSIEKGVDPRYVVSFTSSIDPDFGRRLIELETEVTLQRKSGFDKCGYFSPLQF